MRWAIFSPHSTFYQNKMKHAFLGMRDFIYLSRKPGQCEIDDIKIHARNDQDVDDFDAVYLCTPMTSHVEHTKYFLERGKHVLCEKPLAFLSEDVRSLQKLAQTNNLKLGMTFQPLYKMWDQLTTIPKVTHAQATIKMPLPNPLTYVIYDIGIYPVMTMFAVSGKNIVDTRFSSYDNIYIADVTYENEVTWHIECCDQTEFSQFVELTTPNNRLHFERPYSDLPNHAMYDKVFEDFERENYYSRSIALYEQSCDFLKDWQRWVNSLTDTKT